MARRKGKGTFSGKYRPGKVIRGWDNLHWALANQRAICLRDRCYSTVYVRNLCYCSLDWQLRAGAFRWAILKDGQSE